MFKRTVAIILLCAFMFTIAQVGMGPIIASTQMSSEQMLITNGGNWLYCGAGILATVGAWVSLGFVGASTGGAAVAIIGVYASSILMGSLLGECFG